MENGSKDIVNWGIIGTGGIAHAFASDISYVNNGRLVAVASRTQERADAFAGEYGIPNAHPSYDALYADPDVDAIYIATPHSHHLENAGDALRAGKAVLCEKPLTPTPDEARQLIELAKETGGTLVEAMWTHFLPAIQTTKRWIDEGRIGTVLHVKADFGYQQPYDPDSRLWDPELAGGALLDMGVYPISLAWFFLGQHPESISAVGRRAPTGVDSDVTMRFDYPDVTATLSTSFICRLPNAAYVIGEEGTILIPDFFRTRECTLIRGDETIDHFEDDRESRGYNVQIQSVGEDILAGRQQSSVVPWEATLAFQDHMARVMAEI